jgi:spermidine synthase
MAARLDSRCAAVPSLVVVNQQEAPHALSPRVAGALVFFASGSVLVLEIVGLRLVGPYVGVTLQTSSAVIGVALAAIAYGAWLGGWLADRLDPRRLLGPAMLAAAATTAITVPVVRYAGEVLRGTNAINVVFLAGLALFLPAALLSAVTPLVIKLQLGDLRETGRVVGRLSSVGTLGAITATLATGFVLVAALPTSTIVLVLAGALAVVGASLSIRYGLRVPTRSKVALVVVGLGAGGLAVVAPTPCDIETAYHCALVTADPARPDGRVLWLNSARHSYVDLADPTHLEFAYTQWIAAVAELSPPADILHLGGGGFTLPRYFLGRARDQLVLELDPELVALDRSRLGLRTGPTLRVLTGDGRTRLAAEPSASRDLLIGDAFGHLVVPWHLTTRELVTDVRRVLRTGGVYAQNVIDGPGPRFARAEVATVASVFRHVLVISRPAALEGREVANFVIVASDASLPMAEVAARVATLEKPAEVRDGQGFAQGARVLTDDYAPVDQLLAR